MKRRWWALRAKLARVSGTNIALVLVLSAMAIAVPVGLRNASDPVREAWHAAECGLAGGVVAAALVELGKKLVILRGAFQKVRTDDYFGNAKVADRNKGVMTFLPSRTSFYDVPVEQLGAQISELGDRALAIEDRDVLESLIRPPPAQVEAVQPTKTDAQTDQDLRRVLDNPPYTPQQQLLLRGAIDRRIDEFQVIVSASWQRGLRLVACLLSAGAGMLIAFGIDLGAAGITTASIAGFVVGGVLSWTLGDVLRIVEHAGR